MYAPHTVTIYNFIAADTDGEQETNITILRGVFLDISEGSNMMKSGLNSADAAMLYIPMDMKAVNAVTGQTQRYIPPKEYDRLEDKSGFWTIGRRDRQSGSDCFFVKDEVVDMTADYNGINDRYDYVYRVSTVDIRNFGSPEMWHLQIGGK